MGRFILLTLGLLVVAVSLNGIGAAPPCPTDWSPIGQFCYRFYKEQKTWKEAEAFCGQEQNGSHLVSILSMTEATQLTRLVSRGQVFSSVWTGLHDPEEDGTWKWSDGSNFCYTAWRPGQPNNGDDKENCAVLIEWLVYFRWEEANCESKLSFVCKLQPKPVGSA